MEEPKIIINGIELSTGAAMTVRVAIESFAVDLTVDGLGEDERGKAMTAGYLAQIAYIRRAIYGPQK